MVGEYFYYNVNPGGTIDVGAADSPWLAGGWSEPERRGGWPPFRWAVYPRACVRVPLQGPSALAGFVRARAPGRIPGQWMRPRWRWCSCRDYLAGWVLSMSRKPCRVVSFLAEVE